MTKLLPFLLILGFSRSTYALALPSSISNKIKDLQDGYQLRKTADPSFLAKSATEVFIAAGTQVIAEWERRGSDRLLPEIDFVFAGVLTAIYGKYTSMWKCAKTTTTAASELDNTKAFEPSILGLIVPTNCFQEYMLDGKTVPTTQQRAGSLVAPMGPLFRAGMWASVAGYGFTQVMTTVRSLIFPNYLSATHSVNILYVSLYTGVFMAIVSNIRYQLLQGLVEPAIEKYAVKVPLLQASLIFLVRVANGILGSMLAITGIRMLGIQRLR